MSTPNLNSDDYYAVLGCPRSANDAQLKKAYRKLAVKWHPDKNPDDEQATKNFQKISEAYATLSDPKKRKLYDQYGKDGVDHADQMGGDGPGPGFGFHSSGGGPGGAHHMSPDEAQAFFSQFFGNDDPFGGFGGGFGGGGPRMHFNTSTNGRPGGGSRRVSGADPFHMMFGGGMPGMSQSMGGGMPGGIHMGGMPGMGGGMGGNPFGGGFAQQQPKRYDAIPPETIVSLKGLVNAADRNGDRGVIQQYNPQNGRYVVVLEDTNDTMSVKPSNLLQHVHVRLHNIESLPQLNGQRGTIIAWNSSKERYSIYVTSMSKAVGLKPENVILEEGTVGQIVGLQAKPELNNKFGTIKSWVRDSNRYNVQLSADKIIRVKVENIRV